MALERRVINLRTLDAAAIFSENVLYKNSLGYQYKSANGTEYLNL